VETLGLYSLSKSFTFGIITTIGDNMENQIETKWEEIKTLVASLNEDVTKNAAGNAAAGRRARKGLRTLKTQAGELVKLTLGKE